MTETINNAAAWKGAEIVNNPRWQFILQAADIEDIDAGLRHCKNLALEQQDIRADHFPLKAVKAKFAQIAEELEHGCGFVRLRGLPLDRWPRTDLELVWTGLACHLGQPVFQNSDGQLLREIRAESGNVGQRHGQLATAEGQFLSSRARTASNAELRFHTDRSDIVGLLCTGIASQGGLSKIASSVTVHNEMLTRYPEQCRLLYLDMPRSRIGEELGGEKAWYRLPVWGVRDGKFTSHYSRTFIEALEHVAGAPEVTAGQWQALVVHAENKVMFSRSTIDFGKAQPAGNGPVLSKGCNAVQNRLCCGPSGAAVWGRLGVAFLAKGRAINCETRLDSPPHSHSERYLIFRMDH